jgi:hypothetical protein
VGLTGADREVDALEDLAGCAVGLHADVETADFEH